MRRREAPTAELAYSDAESGVKPTAGLSSTRPVSDHGDAREGLPLTRGRPRSNPEPEEPPITLAEAARRGLWAVYRISHRHYGYAPAGAPYNGVFCAWAVDEDAARNAANERAIEDLHPEGGRHNRDRT